MDINEQIATKLEEKLNKEALEVNPAVAEKPAEEPVDEPAGGTVPISVRSDKLSKSMERLAVIAKRYGFRPFTEAVGAVENDWRDVKSGIDLIS